MTRILQVGNRTVTSTELMTLLTSYQLLPQLWRELLLDEAIAPIQLTELEQASALEQFEVQHQLRSQERRQTWLERYGMTLEQLEAAATRSLRIEKFKQATWGPKLESYFLNSKSQLDRVIYSLIRTKELEVATELYFRIQAQEQSFAECARIYSQGPEAQTGGLLGPVELSQPHPALVKLLAMSQPGQLWPPTRLGEWFVIVRLEQLVPAQLDAQMQKQLMDRLFESWLTEQMHQQGDLRLLEPAKALVAV